MKIFCVTDMDGICYEGADITPEYEVSNTPVELAVGKDTQLEYARDIF